MAPRESMLSIWFFVGLLLTLMGAVVALGGVVDYRVEPYTALGHLHPALGWGGIMVAAGALCLGVDRGRRG